jgi:uncharacterized protein
MFENVFELYIVFTRNCNLRCTYCYQSKTNKSINKETIDKIIDFIKEYKLIRIINLFGGEAFLELDMINYFIDKLIEIQSDSNRTFTIYTNTNGTVYNDKFVNLINKITNNFEFRYVVSIDGNKKFHDTKRRTISNKPTYDLIINNIKRMRIDCPKAYIDFHTVIQKEMCYEFYKVAKDICRNPLFDWGAFEFLMKTDGKVHYTLKDIENIYKGIMMLNEEGYSLDFLEVRFNNIIKSIDYRYNNFGKEKEYCPNGQNALAIDYNGKVYPCDFYLTIDEDKQDQYKIYDLNTKEYKDNIKRLEKLIYETESESNKCLNCNSRQFCRICTGVKEINPSCGLEIECIQNKMIFKAMENIKFKLQ